MSFRSPKLQTALLVLTVALGLFDRGLAAKKTVEKPKINKNAGRDHYPRVNWSLLTGGGVKPGQLIGGTDKAGASQDDATDITLDDIAATIYRSLGIDPLTEYTTNTGRPAMLVPHGRMLTQLFG